MAKKKVAKKKPTIDPSHIWVGQFRDNAPENYFLDPNSSEEAHAAYEARDYELFNQFAEEQGESSLDYDFCEVSFVEWAEGEDPREFIDGHSYSESYLEEVVALVKKLKMRKINVFILASEGQVKAPKSVKGKGYRLEYLGIFDCVDDDPLF